MSIILSTWSFSARGAVAAWPALATGGSSLQAVETVCAVVDDDPEVDSVGYGGLPDRDGTMSLDGCLMLSPARCGSVCALRRHRHPVSVARDVMTRTPHVMVVGEGADAFADQHGHPVEDLLAPAARARYEAWRARPVDEDQTRDAGRPIDTGNGGALFGGHDVGHDTVSVLALDDHGVLAGASSTSGTPYKVPGRVGDSPIIGHGLFVEPGVGAVAATGWGELIMGVCASFLAVERLRAGDGPLAALEVVLDRIEDAYELKPIHQVGLIAMTADGVTAAAALRPGFLAVRTTGTGPEVMTPGHVRLPDSVSGTSG